MQELINNLQQTFEHLEFDEKKHQYKFFNIKLTPVSYIVSKFYKPFDTHKMAIFTARKRGVTVQEMLKEWEDKKISSCTLGTNTHLFAENWTPESIPKNGMEESVSNYFNALIETKNPIIHLLKEFRMFSKKLLIAGTVDRIDYNPLTNKYICVDYKTNEDLYKNYKGQKMLAPFSHLLDSPFNKYQIQLSLYKMLFELTGEEVESMQIIWFRPDGTFLQLECADLTPQLKEYFYKEYLC
jgi:hypothetical protein